MGLLVVRFVVSELSCCLSVGVVMFTAPSVRHVKVRSTSVLSLGGQYLSLAPPDRLSAAMFS